METVIIQDIQECDYDRVIEINQSEVQHTSQMDSLKLKRLLEMACFAKVAKIGNIVTAFILTMRESQPYESENYLWFSARYTDFIYIDRIVVDKNYIGKKIGSKIYVALFQYAKSIGIKTVTCEIKKMPPNEPSRIFHEKLGFLEVGIQWVSNNSKKVSMQIIHVL